MKLKRIGERLAMACPYVDNTKGACSGTDCNAQTEITVLCPGYRKTESAVRVGASAVYFLSIQCEAK